MYLISAKLNLLNHASTDRFIEHWKDTKCYRDLLSDKYFRQVIL